MYLVVKTHDLAMPKGTGDSAVQKVNGIKAYLLHLVPRTVDAAIPGLRQRRYECGKLTISYVGTPLANLQVS